MKHNNEVLTPAEAARVLKVSKSWLYKKIEEGEIPVVRLPGGRLMRISKAALGVKFGLTELLPAPEE